MALWIFAVLVGHFVKGMCGFADTLIETSILGFREDNVTISPVALLLGVPTNLIMVIKNRAALSKRVWIPLSLLVLLGNIPGVWLLKTIDATVIKCLFGALTVFLAGQMLYRSYRPKELKINKAVLAIIGFAAGLCCGLFGVGSILAAYVGRVSDDAGAFKGNMCMVFLMENLFRIVLYSATGILTLASVTRALWVLPAMFLALFLGMKCSSRFNEQTARRAVNWTLLCSGILIIFNALR